MQKMKLFIMQLVCLFVLLAIQTPAFSQSKAVLTVNLDDVAVLEVLKTIEKETGYAFFYNNADVDVARKVSVHLSEASVPEVISAVLPEYECRLENKKIILVRRSAPAPVAVHSDKKTVEITGVIKDSMGEPLTGASVLVNMNGKPFGATADLDGKFSISLPSEPQDETIVFSFMGFKDMVLELGNQSYFDVVLQDDNELLSESVVVGYGVQKKVNLTGAVAAVSADELTDRPVASVGQALQGVVPNLNITQSSGQPGAGSTFNIRGNTSPNGGSPLILVDGMETSLDRINSNDIESISVLKDAVSAAIYGARGAFGVILVTTKSGKFDSAPKVSADARFSFSKSTTSTDFENRGYYHAYIADLFHSSNHGIRYTKYTDEDMQRMWERRNDVTEHPDRPWVLTEMRNGKLSYIYLANFDWYDYLYDESRPTQDYNVTVSGGSKNLSYMVSGRYYHQRGMFRVNPDSYDALNARAKVDIKIRPWLKLSNNTKIFNGQYSHKGNNYRKPTLHALSSFVPVNPDGTPVSHTALTSNSGHFIMDGYSAMIQKGVTEGKNRTMEVSTLFTLTADITKHLKFNADFSYKFGYLRQHYREATVEYSMYPGEIAQESPKSYHDYLKDIVYEQNNWATNAYLAYSNTWKNAHDFTGTVGVNYEARRYKDLSVSRGGLLSEDLADFNLAVGELEALTGGVSQYALAGAFFRFTYGYKSRYLIETNGRYDGSSRFPKGNKWGFFPSVSGAWRISEEPWMVKVKDVMNNAKLRISYGALGNQNIGYYDYYQTVDTSGLMDYSFDKATLAGSASVGDPVGSGTWEKVSNFDIGLDLGFWGDKLTFTGDFYIRDTKGILTVGKQLPSIYGATEPKVNANDMRTTGWEIQLEWRDDFMLAGHRFDYSIGGNLSDYVAYYTKADNPDGLLNSPYVGKRLGEIWGYRVGGLFQSDLEAGTYASMVDMSQVCKDYFRADASEYGKGVRAGDMKYLDLNGDGVITSGNSTLEKPGDREIIGNSQPRFSYGFNAGFNWFGFDFSIFFQGIGHMDWYPGGDNQRFWGAYSRAYSSFIGKDFMSNVWTEANKEAYFPRARGASALNSAYGSLYYTNDRYLQNLAYLRLKNVTFGYTFPQKWMEKARISKLRLYFSGENLWHWTALHSKYLDPEMAMADKSSDVYSWCKTFSFGVTLDF